MGDKVAGHDFDPITGKCVTIMVSGERTGEVCGVAWLAIRNTQPEDVGQHGIAHVSGLNLWELAQIIAKRTAEDDRLALAMAEVTR